MMSGKINVCISLCDLVGSGPLDERKQRDEWIAHGKSPMCLLFTKA